MTIHIWRLKVCKQFNLPLFCFREGKKFGSRKKVLSHFSEHDGCVSRGQTQY
jgi:hypothetical protein